MFTPNQITAWKAQLLDGAAEAPSVDLKALHAKIGELALENDFLEGALIKAGMLTVERWRCTGKLLESFREMRLVGLANFAWDLGARHGDPVLLAGLSFFEPLASTALIAVVLAKPVGWLDAAAGALILIARLATTRRSERSNPHGKRLRRQPQGQAATSAEPRLIVRPVRHLEFHLADAMAAGGIVFERHRCDKPVIGVAARLHHDR
jgi:hypothetical protein